MSWSVREQGSKEEVRGKASAAFDHEAARYSGKEEEKDVLAVKERLLVELDGFPDGHLVPDGDASNGYDVQVYGYGSRIDGQGWCSLHGEISRVKRGTDG